MGLLGKSFRDFVSAQVTKRQEVLGEENLRFGDGGKTKAFINNTPWIRLASSVNLDFQSEIYTKIKETFGKDFSSDGLSKEFVLFGGVNNSIGGTNNAYSGLNSQDSNKFFGGAYGFGSWNQLFSNDGKGYKGEEGYKPMPGITNVDFSYRNDGALSQASITVKAFNRIQFQIIDLLFQRPGYTVLLEFGHSVFIDNDGNIQYAGEGNFQYSTTPFQTFFNPGENSTENVSHYTLAKAIDSEKARWQGNYEGAFMKITKYKWKYNTDGSYDITINLVGIGDIISSLKTNIIPIDKISKSTINEGDNETDLDQDDLKDLREEGNFIIGDALSSTLNLELYKIYKKSTDRWDWWSEEISTSDVEIKDFPTPIYDDEGFIKHFKSSTLKFPKGAFLINNPDQEGGAEDYDDFCYITFGCLISLITSSVNFKDNNKVPYVFFDLNYQDGEIKDDENYIATYEGNFSSNPSKILIPFKKLSKVFKGKLDPELEEYYDEVFNEEVEIVDALNELNPQFYVKDDKNRGRLERVYLDVNYLAKTLSENTIDGECKLIDFLNQILNDINVNLGGLNNFRIIFNQDKQLVSFISESPVCFEDEKNENLSTINTVGLTQGQGSFVKDIDLNSELSDDFASIITIGAQANGNNRFGNSTSFSIYNEGLTDRIIPVKEDIREEGKDSQGNKPEDPIKNAISEEFIDALAEIYDNYNFFPEYINLISQYNSTITPLITGELTKSKQYPAPFFLPFNLGLTLHGLGGIRIYDGFRVDGKMLPLSYNSDNISLIIKSLSHNVSLDGWTTKIETLSKPIPKSKSTSK